MTKKVQPKRRRGGAWVFVPDDPEKQLEDDKQHVIESLFGLRKMDFPARCLALEQYYDYFPEEAGRVVPDGGCWILVIEPPNTEYSVAPFSFWFAEPWPMDYSGDPTPKRVKIITPSGELGLFPREYRVINEPERYYEFVGNGITLHFFGGEAAGVPEDQLFYLRSRGIAQRDAIGMLIKSIRTHGVLWMECDSDLAVTFHRG